MVRDIYNNSTCNYMCTAHPLLEVEVFSIIIKGETILDFKETIG